MEVKLALSPKQHASLRLGRKVRIHSGHLSGSGVPYKFDPETVDKMERAFDKYKGVDVSLSPDGQRAVSTARDYAEPYMAQGGRDLVSDARSLDYVKLANAASHAANSFQPFSKYGSVSMPTSGGALYLGKVSHYLEGTGLGAIHAPLHRAHQVLRSAAHNEGYLEQLPQLYKDAKRIGAGFTLM